MHVTVCRSDEPFGSWFSFHYVAPRDQTQVIRTEGEYFYLLSHLASPSIGFLERCVCVLRCVCLITPMKSSTVFRQAQQQ